MAIDILDWFYLADGTKVQKTAKRAGLSIAKQDYFRGIEYRGDTLDAIYIEDAKLVFESGNFKEHQYYLKDNVGNTRVIYRDSLGTPVIVNESHYYPNGGLMAGDWQKDTRAKYLYNGIERVNDFGLDVYHAKYRTLDQWTGNWWQIDPEVERFAAWSPYNQNLRNSISLSDPDGDCPTCAAGAVIGGIAGGIVGFFSTKGSLKERLKNAGKKAVSGAIGGAIIGSGVGLAAFAGGGLATTASITATSGFVAGAATSITEQGIEMAFGERQSLDEQETVTDALIGVPANFVGLGIGNAATAGINKEFTKQAQKRIFSRKATRQFKKHVRRNLKKSGGFTKKQARTAAKAAVAQIKNTKSEGLEAIRVRIQSGTATVVETIVNGTSNEIDNTIGDEKRKN